MKFSLVFLLFLPQWCICYNSIEDDLVFDDVGDEPTSSLTKSDSVVIQHEENNRELRHRDHRYWEHKLPNKKSTRVNEIGEGLWDISHRNVTVGHVFKLEIQKYAFGENIERYEAHVKGHNKGFPSWLYWDESTNTLLGVPTKKDVGQYNVIIKAFEENGNVIENHFPVSVVMHNIEEKLTRHKDKKNHCEDDQDPTFSMIFVNARYEKINPELKVKMIEKLAEFLGLNLNVLSIYPHYKEKYITVIQWQVGCDGRLWKKQDSLINQLREQFKNGNLDKVLQMPVIRWQLKTDTSKDTFERSRRDAGSGDSINGQEYDGYDVDNEDYDEDYDEGDDDDLNKESVTETSVNSLLPQSKGNGVKLETEAEHPHRHHHGEESIDLKQIEEIDEHDIVPILDHGEASGFNNSSTSSSITTTKATTTINTFTTTSTDNPSPSPSFSSSSSSSSSSISSATSTQSSSNTFETTRTIIREPESTTITTPALFNLSTSFAASNTTVTGTETVPEIVTGIPETSGIFGSSSLPSSVGTTNDLSEKEDKTDTITLIDSDESATTLLFTSTAQTTTMDVITTVEKQQPKTTVQLNVTSEEPEEESTVYSTRETTTTPITTVTFTSAATSAKVSINTTAVDTTTQQTQKTLETSSTTEIPSTTTTAKPPVTPNNSPPVLMKRVQKIFFPAGQATIAIIPDNTFYDEIDGYTRNLQLSLHPKHEWIDFNSETQEIYMVPLVKDISTHYFQLTATNSRGLTASEEIQVTVQQENKNTRIEFEFNMYLEILRPHVFPADVFWKYKVAENLVKLYGDKNSSNIVITEIHVESNHRAIFSWTNATLPVHQECPVEQIERILEVLVDKDGNPSQRVKDIFLPTINVTNVLNRPHEHSSCKNSIIKYVKSEFTTEIPPRNLHPMLRNHIDQLNCTAGKLFVFKVPEDTFFDSKDGSTRNLHVNLLNYDGSEISPNDWLQFDKKNQEFYGIPMRSDAGTKQYYLEAKDPEGLATTDGLTITVYNAKETIYSVEFSMTLEVPYESFARSAKRKRLFIEKIAELFGDDDTSAILLESITRGSTVVTWRNTSLATNTCPNEEIDKLRKVVVKEDKTLTDRVDIIMGNNDFPVKQITLTPLGSCLGEMTGIHKQDVISSSEDSRTVGSTNDEYLITFVLPAIIILAMLILAGIIACIFYKRRRSGKMSISEQDDERQSFRNKGIPVIFQDELDEKPDPGNKSPIILKEEKPPLPPPEYQKSEDGADVPMLSKENSEEPYQPPPPFATNRDNNRQNRPKPTPTYRKPPPYVPP